MEFQHARVQAATTTEAQLAACFDRFRAAAARTPEACSNVTKILMDHAAQMHKFTLADGLGERALAALKRAHDPAGKLRAAFAWYRGEAARMRRLYGDDPDLIRTLAADIHDVAVYLNSRAVELERASEPAASSRVQVAARCLRDGAGTGPALANRTTRVAFPAPGSPGAAARLTAPQPSR